MDSTSASSTSVLRLVPEHRADRSGDVARVERGRGHLVEHRLKEVVVPAIDQGHPDRGALEPRAAYRPAKPPPRIRTWGLSGTASVASLAHLSLALSLSPLTSLQPHGLAAPPGKPDHVLQRRYGILVGIGSIHSPAQIGSVRQRQKRRLCPPAPPRKAHAVRSRSRPSRGLTSPPPGEPTGERQPGVGHGPSIMGIFRSL